MTITLLWVAAGGALGASARFALSILIVRAMSVATIPVAILSINVIGSLMMGLFVVMAAHRGWTHAVPFVATGLLGGFTTFSAFSLETATLMERGQISAAAIYIVASVCLSVGAFFLGAVIARSLI